MYLQLFDVTGYGSFPFDMLRYDSCWPATEEDSYNIDGNEERTISLKRYTHTARERPNVGR